VEAVAVPVQLGTIEGIELEPGSAGLLEESLLQPIFKAMSANDTNQRMTTIVLVFMLCLFDW
jgi:hypothetical protein